MTLVELSPAAPTKPLEEVSGRAARKGPSPSMSVARGAAWLLSTQPLTWCASLLTATLLPRYLGDQAVGQLTIALAIAGFAGFAASFGLPNYLQRQIAVQRNSADILTAGGLFLVAVLAPLTAAAVWMVAALIGFSSVQNQLLLIALAGMIANSVKEIVFSGLLGQERHGRFAWLNAASVSTGAIVGVGVLMAGGGASTYLATTVAVSGAMAAIGLRVSGLKISRPAVAVRHLRLLALGGVPFLAWNLTLQVRNQVDVIMVAALLNEQAVGWLAAAERIMYIPLFIPTLIATPLLPALSRCATDVEAFRRAFHRSLVAVLVISIPLGAMTLVLAPAIPELLGWGSGFAHSVPLMSILAIDQPLMSLGIVQGTGLITLRDERRWLCVGVLAAIANPALNFIMIPLFEQWHQNGAIGAALAEIVTELVMITGALVLLPRGLLDFGLLALAGKIMVAAICLVLVAAVALTAPLPLLVSAPLSGAVGVIAFIVALLMLGVVRFSDLQNARHLLHAEVSRRLAVSP